MATPRPLFKGEWNETHVDWFIQKFHGETKEIDARKVQQLFGNRRDDEFTDPSDKAYDFRVLMRLIVKNGLARVTQDFSWSKHYKIKMVSSDYPYTVEIFDDLIFLHPIFSCPFLGVFGLAESTEAMTINLIDRYGFQLSSKILRYEIAFRRFNAAFHLYQYCGGDIEEAFPEFNDREAGEFILKCIAMISMYRLIKLVCIKSTKLIALNYNNIFIKVLKAKFSSELIVMTETKNKYSNSHFEKCLREAMNCLTSGEEVSKETPKVLFGINPSDTADFFEPIDTSAAIHAFAAGEWLALLAEKKFGEDLEVKTALKEWKKNLLNLCASELRRF